MKRGALRAIDHFFESLAQDQRECAIGIVLSGTASDGTLGLEAIKAEGGITFAQDASAKYDSMPRSAVAAGCVDLVLSPESMAQELARIARHPSLKKGLSAAGPSAATAPAQEDTAEALSTSAAEQNGFKKVLLHLRTHSGVDFSLYKPRTIHRRITRRMVLNKIETLDAYAHSLRGNVAELDALYRDILISVTSFFRNPEAFEVLERKVSPKIVEGGDPSASGSAAAPRARNLIPWPWPTPSSPNASSRLPNCKSSPATSTSSCWKKPVMASTPRASFTMSPRSASAASSPRSPAAAFASPSPCATPSFSPGTMF
jgi:hypothetical protein